jgi:hypothetical protein
MIVLTSMALHILCWHWRCVCLIQSKKRLCLNWSTQIADLEINNRTLSGRLSLMRNVQLMRKKKRYIPCVPHENNCKKKIDSHDISETDSSIIIIRNACVLTSASTIVYLFFTRSWSAIIGRKSSNLVSRAYPLHYCTGQHNHLLSNILRFALKICFWADF